MRYLVVLFIVLASSCSKKATDIPAPGVSSLPVFGSGVIQDYIGAPFLDSLPYATFRVQSTYPLCHPLRRAVEYAYSYRTRPVGEIGVIRYNGFSPGFEFYDGTQWADTVPVPKIKYESERVRASRGEYFINETAVFRFNSEAVPWQRTCPPVSDTSTLEPQPIGMCIIFQDSVYIRFTDRWHNLER